jgi:monoamine oxidase
MTEITTPSRRQLLTMIGKMGGAAAMYQAMTAMGHAAETQFTAPPVLTGAKPGASVVILGAGLAGMTAAYELEKAGYAVKIIEFQDRPGGRNYSLRGGDTFTESDGTVQKVQFQPGNYVNPGPWRIPHHHKCLLHYCRQFGVALEPFIQLNHNGFIHSSEAFGGKPMRYKEVATDYRGHTSELLAKALNAGSLDQAVTAEDKEKLLESLRRWGLLDSNMAYTSSVHVSSQRGYDRPPGGGRNGAPTPSQIAKLGDVLAPQVWTTMSFYFDYVMQTTMFQPVGGMDMIGKAFAAKVGKLITYNAKVTKVAQSGKGVTVSYKDVASGKVSTVSADYCVCTIPLSIISQVEMQVGPKLAAAMKAVPYAGHIKMGMEFKRRFWEEDDNIYGGHSFTDQAIGQLSYPNDRMFQNGPAVLLGAFTSGAGALELTGMTPAERIEAALAQGEVFHPQYRKEFLSGVSVPWTRVPWILGCTSRWSEENRAAHYKDLVTMDGRVVLAGEHASFYGGWMEGSMLSGLDAISQIHERATAA